MFFFRKKTHSFSFGMFHTGILSLKFFSQHSKKLQYTKCIVQCISRIWHGNKNACKQSNDPIRCDSIEQNNCVQTQPIAEFDQQNIDCMKTTLVVNDSPLHSSSNVSIALSFASLSPRLSVNPGKLSPLKFSSSADDSSSKPGDELE